VGELAKGIGQIIAHLIRANERLEAGQPLPGVVIIPKELPIGSAIEELAILLACSQPEEFPNRVIHLPL
jgi:hypothetical protein